jgi:hypothetical protein
MSHWDLRDGMSSLCTFCGDGSCRFVPNANELSKAEPQADDRIAKHKGDHPPHRELPPIVKQTGLRAQQERKKERKRHPRVGLEIDGCELRDFDCCP